MEYKTKINPDVWEEWLLIAKMLYKRNPEADIYDVFNHIRVEHNGGHNNYGQLWNSESEGGN